ncbi:WD repeat-containing protein 93 [Chelonia mydas]|uniref:WD repeat-containing protein 93 n=1 Tax=Chelonia mydas TaxID=8469 RepID=M7BAK2_CHEMY|nr:WD repeat-containing protein 93 [Chelonia mydas]
MPVYIRKHPLEIPPPSEKDWIKKDEEENFFLQDPDQIFDSLPQPFRMINKLVTLVFEHAWEIIEKKEALREAQTLKVQPKLYLPTAEFQVMGRTNCLAASGQHVFVGLSTGLAVFSMPNCKRVCAWESAKLEICAIRTSNLGNETHLLITVDEMGLARLFYFYKDSLLLIKVLNEVESPMSANRVETKLSPPVLLLKVRSPKPLTGSTFKSPLEALMKTDDGSVIGLGQNHVIKDYQWEQQDAIFRSTFQKHLERESEPDNKEEKPSHAVFHFLLPGRILQIGPEIKAQPDVPTGITVHWKGSHNLCLYLLTRPSKEKTGFPLAVTALPEGCLSRTIHFLQTSTAPTDQLPRPKVQLLVLCTDGSLHLVIISGPRESRTVLLADRPSPRKRGWPCKCSPCSFCALLLFQVLVFSWDGTVCLTDTAAPRPVCHFITPPSHTVASPWQPVFTVDTTNHGLLLRGDEQQQQAGPQTQTKDKQSSIFLFNFDSYLSMEVFPAVPEPPPESLQHLPWVERCDIFLRDRLQRLPGLSQQVPKCWSQLRKHAAALQRESRKK